MCQSRSTIIRGILICVFLDPGICKNTFLCLVLHWNGDNCILFENFTASIFDLMGEFHQKRNNSTVVEELSVSIVDLTNYFFSGRNWKSRVAGKTAFTTVKSIIDISYSSNTVLLFLNYTL
jgi:hypothetical protein